MGTANQRAAVFKFMSKGKFKNRIIGYGSKPADEFVFNPDNWRKHGDAQRAAIDGILSEVGWVTGVIENETTGNLIDGHARVEQALQRNPKEPVPFIKVKLTADEEKKVLAVLDPIGGMAQTDTDVLNALLKAINFESDALNDLVSVQAADDIDLDQFFTEKSEDLIPVDVKTFELTLIFENESDLEEVKTALSKIDADPAKAVRSMLEL